MDHRAAIIMLKLKLCCGESFNGKGKANMTSRKAHTYVCHNALKVARPFTSVKNNLVNLEKENGDNLFVIMKDIYFWTS